MGAIYKLLACEVMHGELESLLHLRTDREKFDVEWLPMRLHEHPDRLHTVLAGRVAACAGRGYDAILLLFGLCSRATDGLGPPPDSRLVVPRVHDCIDLQLGSTRRRLAEQAAEAGTFWFGRGFIRGAGNNSEVNGLGAGFDGYRAGGRRKSLAEIRKEFADSHGEEGADYLAKTLLEAWRENYSRAVFLDWEENPSREVDRAFVATEAKRSGWRFETIPVNLRLLSMLLDGEWTDEEFAVATPGRRLRASGDERAIEVVDAD